MPLLEPRSFLVRRHEGSGMMDGSRGSQSSDIMLRDMLEQDTENPLNLATG